MFSSETLSARIRDGALDRVFSELYPDTGRARARYAALADRFAAIFGSGRDCALFSAPGRTEIGGNHTDHQHGRVLAAAVDADTVAAAAPNGDGRVRLHSEGFAPLDIDLSDLSVRPEEKETSAALIRGVAAGFANRGLKIGGFDAVVTSDVLKGSGLSSSAAFEVLTARIFAEIYNEGRPDAVETAKIAGFAENAYFGKPSGLMDQTASAVGGFVGIDFADPERPIITPVDYRFEESGHLLCIVNTGGDHADLTSEYAAVTGEMRRVAEYFGRRFLRDVPFGEFSAVLPDLRRHCGDRAVLRALHFFEDDERAARERDALTAGDFAAFLRAVRESGRSSVLKLQNIYAACEPSKQGLSLALALAERVLGRRGAFRVHGGGFGGTVQAFVPEDLLDEFVATLDAVFGQGACGVLRVRRAGGICLNPNT